MSKVNYIKSIVLFAAVLVGINGCKKDDPPAVVLPLEGTFEVVGCDTSLDLQNVALYVGDTICFDVNYDLVGDIESLLIEIHEDGVVHTSDQFNPTETSNTYHYEYIIPEAMLGKEISVDANIKGGITNWSTGFSSTVKSIYEYNNMRLYNIHGENYNNYMLLDYQLVETNNKGIGGQYLLFNLYNEDELGDQNFNRAWVGDVYSGVAEFKKTTQLYDNFTKPNDFKEAFNNSTSIATDTTFVESGDVYLFKQHWNDPSYIDTYGIIEVVNIFDDLLEAKNGGSDLDYIEFNLKTYDPRRF